MNFGKCGKDQMKKHEPFKIPIWEFELDIDNDILNDYCLQFSKETSTVIKSNQGGYQSPTRIPNLHPPFCTLVSDVEWKLREIQETPLVVSNIWFNINRYKDTNLPHLHPMSHYSGVYYVKTPRDCGNICLEHPALDLLYHYPNGGKDALFIGEAKEKRLYIFPSWLKHYVSPNLNKDQERISISFNTTNGGG